MLGEHTREVLAECGYSDAEIDRFVADRIVEEPSARVAGPAADQPGLRRSASALDYGVSVR